MKLTLNIQDASTNKALSLIEYLKSLDFLTVEQEEMIIPEWHQQIVRDRIETLEISKFLDWDEVKETIKK
jgi:sulfur carrier protein ThiS